MRVERVEVVGAPRRPDTTGSLEHPSIAGMDRGLREYLFETTDLDSIWFLLDELQYQAADLEEFIRLHRFMFDVSGVLATDTEPERRLLAAERLAEDFSFRRLRRASRVKLQGLVQSLWSQREETIERCFRSMFIVPILTNMHDEAGRPQPVRLGSKWVGGSQSPVVPRDLPFPDRLRWLYRRPVALADEQLSSRTTIRPEVATDPSALERLRPESDTTDTTEEAAIFYELIERKVEDVLARRKKVEDVLARRKKHHLQQG